MPERQTKDSSVLSFGPFTLAPAGRSLSRNGVPVELGARALDILIALASHPNEVVSKNDLLAQVWPDVMVEEGSLRFHITNLRKVLGEGRNGARYIATLAGRGYCFVAPISHPNQQYDGDSETSTLLLESNLPHRSNRMVGRDQDALEIATRLSATRFVTIVGTGGLGKTTVAVAVGHDLARSFLGAAHLVDLGALSDPSLVAATVASMLGLSIQSDEATSSLVAYLKDKRILLILDTCEHLIDAVADFASRIHAAAPQAHILATSRESLRAEGEHIYVLGPLSCPPGDIATTAGNIGTFSAAQLFMESVATSGGRIDLTDASARIVAGICQKLDGVPLAIELAAGRVGGYGLEKTATLLDQHLSLLWPGRRTAPPRQKTLQAALDWSYALLSNVERTVLRRLTVFVGHFTIDAALEVAAGSDIGQVDAFSAIDGLIAKSMVAVRPAGAMMRYRLLDTTRAYALQISGDDDERTELVGRHAVYYLKWLQESGAEWPSLSNAPQRALHLAGLANVRAALDRCFATHGNREIAIQLTTAAAPVFLAMSLLTECHRWSVRALDALDTSARGGREEMILQTALGVSLMFTRGGKDAARVALDRSLSIAERRGDALDQIQVLGPLQMFHLRTAAFNTALRYSQRCATVAATIEDSTASALAHSLMGISLHLGGKLADARTELESALHHRSNFKQTTTIYLGFDAQVLSRAILARTLWLQGYPAQATEHARAAIQDAEGLEHPLSLAIALVWAISVFLWVGDLESADEHIDQLFSMAEPHSLGPYLAVGRGFKGELAIRRGHVDAGVESLQASLAELREAPYELLSTPLNTALVQGLVASDRIGEALARTEETLQSVENNGDLCYMPELLRMKGNLLLSMPHPKPCEAEQYLAQSLTLSRRQGARAWELRTAIDFAGLVFHQGRVQEARTLLQPVFEHFTEGADTADVKAAAQLLAALN